jgi:hypothetical protein
VPFDSSRQIQTLYPQHLNKSGLHFALETSGLTQKFVTQFPAQNLPFPSLPKEGLESHEEIPPLKKGDNGGFEQRLQPLHSFGILK